MTDREFPARLTANEAAEYLRVSPLTLQDWRHKRIGPPYFKVGKRVVYQRSDLDAFMQSTKVQTKVAA